MYVLNDMGQKLRTGHVRRWHIVATSREQTVADHQHRVCIVTEEILRLLGLYDWDSDITQVALRLAFIHDRHEVVMGDIPTPGKAALREAEIEATPTTSIDIPDSIGDAERAIDPEFGELVGACAPGEPLWLAACIVKTADLMESVEWLSTFGVGHHARVVRDGLVGALNSSLVPLVCALGEFNARHGIADTSEDARRVDDFVRRWTHAWTRGGAA